jgi:hypothetical protein
MAQNAMPLCSQVATVAKEKKNNTAMSKEPAQVLPMFVMFSESSEGSNRAAEKKTVGRMLLDMYADAADDANDKRWAYLGMLNAGPAGATG